MNLAYLGDALDHWKGSLFEYLCGMKVLRRFAIDPMISDRSEWKNEDFSRYAHLMRIGEIQLIHHEHDLRKQ